MDGKGNTKYTLFPRVVYIIVSEVTPHISYLGKILTKPNKSATSVLWPVWKKPQPKYKRSKN